MIPYYKTKKGVLYYGDALDIPTRIKPNSVHCVVTSPPYWGKVIHGIEGELGLDETPLIYIDKLVKIFRGIREVLHPTGTVWLNIGDTNCVPSTVRETVLGMKPGVPSKNRIGIPWKVAFALQDDGWHLRCDNIWWRCLAENTNLFVKQKGQYKFLTIKEVFDNYDDTHIQTKNRRGEDIWVRIKKVLYNGKQQTQKITTKSGRYLYATNNHKVVYKKTSNKGKKGSYQRLKTKKIRDLNSTDRLQVNTKINIDIPNGSKDDFTHGFILGFYVAEGTKIKSRSKKPENKNKFVGVQLSCGLRDIERGYIDIIESKYKINKYIYGSNLHIRSFDKAFVNLIYSYIHGNTCKEYNFSNKVFNTSLQFIKGIIHGFSAGDGYKEENIGRWRFNLTPNEKLKDQFELMSNIIGYDFRFEGYRIAKSPICKNCLEMMFSIRYEKFYRKKLNNIIDDQIDTIENNGIQETYDVELEPLYTGRVGNQYKYTVCITKDEQKAKYNNLYFLANGIWVHNSNSPREPVRDRPTYEHEYVFLLTKKQHYFYDKIAVELPYHGHYAGNRKKIVEESGGMFKGGHNIKAELTGRNLGSVWKIPTQGRTDSHYSAFPDELAARCIKAGTSLKGCCSNCYAPIERVIERKDKASPWKTIGWEPTCKCDAGVMPCMVLDPFMGRGTVALVSETLGRNWVGVELGEDSCELIRQNLTNRKVGLLPLTKVQDGLFKGDKIDTALR